MPVLLVKFDEAIPDAAGGMYFAEAVGREREDGLWEAWLEFIPVGDVGKPVTSGRETTQPNRKDLDYWAQGLTRVYLQGALVRAESSTEPVQQDRAAIRPDPTIDYT